MSKTYWLTEIYFDEKERCYKPIGWDQIERGRGNASVRHSVDFYKQSAGQKVILEVEAKPSVEAELEALGLLNLTDKFEVLKDRRTKAARKVPQEYRYILDNLE